MQVRSLSNFTQYFTYSIILAPRTVIFIDFKLYVVHADYSLHSQHYLVEFPHSTAVAMPITILSLSIITVCGDSTLSGRTSGRVLSCPTHMTATGVFNCSTLSNTCGSSTYTAKVTNNEKKWSMFVCSTSDLRRKRLLGGTVTSLLRSSSQ
ncbi:hypothetical protein EV421DRAFT_543762 [Armillaria borealis]|uniref:Uncharacterized protein n=1 Tax=Armillaria borealis TaxID=47425 RepID=A0AA39JIB5_9AGAR|nr:hypothetical protein EV421DRAFT_543762 [Armillaria borealis]